MESKKLLTKEAKSILIQTFTSDVPFYTIQALKLLQVVIDELEQINRNFFWGHEKRIRKLHSLAWDKIYQLKGNGGLGFRRLKETNQAFMAKLAWRLQTQDSSLWSRVLKEKYDSVSRSWEQKAKQQTSFIWKVMCSASKHVENFVWRIGNGKKINFLFDRWARVEPLIKKITCNVP